MYKLLSVVITGFMLSVMSFLASAELSLTNEASTKDFTFNRQGTKPTVETTVRSSDPFDVEVMFNKNVFKVNEDFGFKIKGNDRFFLYVFYIDKKAQKAVLILPTQEHKGNMYPAGQTLNVPSKGSFYADEVGVEEMVIVASKKYFDWDTTGYTKMGDMMATDVDQFNQQVKALRYRPQGSTNSSTPAPSSSSTTSTTTNKPESVVVKKVRLTIEPAQGQAPVASAPSASEKPIVFVSTDKLYYRANETVQLAVGATHAGWVTLYSVDKNQQATLLKQLEIGGPSFQRFNAVAGGPSGYQAIIAVYSDKANLPDIGALVDDVKPTQQKGLIIVDKRPINAAIRQIKVQ